MAASQPVTDVVPRPTAPLVLLPAWSGGAGPNDAPEQLVPLRWPPTRELMPDAPAAAGLRAPDGEQVLAATELRATTGAPLGWLAITIPDYAAGAAGPGEMLLRQRNGRYSVLFWPEGADATRAPAADDEGDITMIDEVEAFDLSWGIAAPGAEAIERATGIRVQGDRLVEVCVPTSWRARPGHAPLLGARCASWLVDDAGAFTELLPDNALATVHGELATLSPLSGREHLRCVGPSCRGGLLQVQRHEVVGADGSVHTMLLGHEWSQRDGQDAWPVDWQDASLALELGRWQPCPVGVAGDGPCGAGPEAAAAALARLRSLRSTSRGVHPEDEDYALLERRTLDHVARIAELEWGTARAWSWLEGELAELDALVGGILALPRADELLHDAPPVLAALRWRARGYPLAAGTVPVWNDNESVRLSTLRGARVCDRLSCARSDDETPDLARSPSGRLAVHSAWNDGDGAVLLVTSGGSAHRCRAGSWCDALRECASVPLRGVPRPGRDQYEVVAQVRVPGVRLDGRRQRIDEGQCDDGVEPAPAGGLLGWIDERHVVFARQEQLLAIDTLTGQHREVSAQALRPEQRRAAGFDADGTYRYVVRSAPGGSSIWRIHVPERRAERLVLAGYHDPDLRNLPEAGPAYAVVSPNRDRLAVSVAGVFRGVWQLPEVSDE